MLKKICDICNKEVNYFTPERLPYKFVNHIWFYNNYETCDDCKAKLVNASNNAQVKKIKELRKASVTSSTEPSNEPTQSGASAGGE